MTYRYDHVLDFAAELERRRVETPWDPAPASSGWVHGRGELSAEEVAVVQAQVVAARRWLVEHLRRVADAMRAVERVDSGDRGLGGELAAIEAVRAEVEMPR